MERIGRKESESLELLPPETHQVLAQPLLDLAHLPLPLRLLAPPLHLFLHKLWVVDGFHEGQMIQNLPSPFFVGQSSLDLDLCSQAIGIHLVKQFSNLSVWLPTLRSSPYVANQRTVLGSSGSAFAGVVEISIAEDES